MLQPMPYTTVALRPETKERLEEFRRAAGFRSMDEAVAAAVDHASAARTEQEVRRLARGAGAAQRRSLLDDLEDASRGLDRSVRTIRSGMRKRLG